MMKKFPFPFEEINICGYESHANIEHKRVIGVRRLVKAVCWGWLHFLQVNAQKK